MRRTWPCLCIATTAATAIAQPLVVTLRNTVALPDTAVDQHGHSFTIAGLSGIAAETRGGNRYWTVMDNSNKMVRFDVTVSVNATIASATLLSGMTLDSTYDFEGIVVRDGLFAHLAEETTPAIRGVDLGFATVSAGFAPPPFSNIRPNFGFESLTMTQGYPSYFWTANEEALSVDGPLSSATAGTVVRICRVAGFGKFTPQYAYLTEPWHGSAISGARSGVCDLVWLPDGRMILLERSFAFSLGGFFQTRVYELDFTSATDVSSMPGLIGQTYTSVSKRLLFQGDQQNLEGLALGPMIGNGRYALIGIVDDGDPISVNRVVGFELSGVGPPLCYINCDQSNSPPILNSNDFICFINAYITGQSYANCDGSTGTPTLTPNDFNCFINVFAAGCP